MKKLWFLIIVLLLLVACSEEEKPEYTNPYDTANEYVELWQEHNFNEIYQELLLERTTAKYGEDDYIERYENLYDVLGVNNLSIELSEEKVEFTEEEFEELVEYEIPITISFETIAGTVEYEKTLPLEKAMDEEYVGESDRDVNPESPWYVGWDPSFIMPGLEDGDEVKLSSVPASRGEIVDRNGELLATNGEVYQIGIIPESFSEEEINKLAGILDISEETINSALEQNWVQPHHFVPIKKVSLNDDDIMARATSIAGVQSNIEIDRVYPYGEAAAHLTGYIGNITAEELEDYEEQCYTAQDRIGKRGLEQLYEDRLRGEDGREIYIEKQDQSQRTVVQKDPQDGDTIELSIDINEQVQLYEVLKEEAGTAVTVNPTTGEVTSLVSFPAFDPNDYILGFTKSSLENLNENEENPTLNRFATRYSPGSTIKPLTTIVGLNEGILDPNETRTIEGKEWQNNESWGNYHVTRVYENDTEVDLESAFKNSDNIYFAMLGLDIGAENFSEGFKNLGFGEDLPFEYPIPNSQVSNTGKIDREVLLADSSYGQGQVLMSLLHLTSIYGGITNDGTVMKPLLLTEEESEAWINDMVSEDNASLIQDMLRSVVSNGTAQSIDLQGKEISGKTGTAELKSSQDDENAVENGLFVSYDQQNPNRVLGILIEGVEEQGGSSHVVDLAKEIYENR
ncbi:penicillin-binding transpeptidase domain-containing protein [Aquisalibacillus elongatus]|uniref:serine-type D-Ala-D-Ala carboxypeptidase n=1 Tax=Aquisalibacillus elongatus TaxID=485577 RepID=A0A3N5BEG5_9BACI|nr:penicillin-binding transpeptidase domain-containing protein [Aquisalibacillus elongatus]RPF55837.1 penicillin-binding protein [Aquisalibacillus elongatus]